MQKQIAVEGLCVRIDLSASVVGKETGCTAEVCEVNPERRKINASCVCQDFCLHFHFFNHGTTAPNGPGSPHYRGFMHGITALSGPGSPHY